MLYFIVNITSGTGQGKKVWSRLRATLKSKNIEYKAFATRYEGHATELACKISSLKDDDICLVVIGGDGTINEVLNGIKDFDKVRFAAISNGSGNDFARGMGLPSDAVENLNSIIEAASKGKDYYFGIDLGKALWNNGVNSRIFGISAGIGLDAIVCQKALHSRLKKVLNYLHMGKLTYIFLTVYSLFSMDTVDIDLKLEDTNGVTLNSHMNKLIFLAAMNQFAEGGGVPMAPDASCTDGLLSFSSASGIPKWRTFFCLPLLMAAKQENIRGFEIVNGSCLQLKMSKPIVLHTDGEDCGEVTDVTFTCLKGKLKYLK